MRHSKTTKETPVVPAARGYRMPAEWEPHEATWLGWPHNDTDWPGKLDTIRWVYGEIVRKISPGETVRLQDGQTFLFFTDGAFECTNPKGEEFGLVRMEKILQANVYKSTPEILNAIGLAIEEFTRGVPLEDDLCLLAVDVTTKPRT